MHNKNVFLPHRVGFRSARHPIEAAPTKNRNETIVVERPRYPNYDALIDPENTGLGDLQMGK